MYLCYGAANTHRICFSLLNVPMKWKYSNWVYFFYCRVSLWWSKTVSLAQNQWFCRLYTDIVCKKSEKWMERRKNNTVKGSNSYIHLIWREKIGMCTVMVALFIYWKYFEFTIQFIIFYMYFLFSIFNTMWFYHNAK